MQEYLLGKAEDNVRNSPSQKLFERMSFAVNIFLVGNSHEEAIILNNFTKGYPL